MVLLQTQALLNQQLLALRAPRQQGQPTPPVRKRSSWSSLVSASWQVRDSLMLWAMPKSSALRSTLTGKVTSTVERASIIFDLHMHSSPGFTLAVPWPCMTCAGCQRRIHMSTEQRHRLCMCHAAASAASGQHQKIAAACQWPHEVNAQAKAAHKHVRECCAGMPKPCST